MAQYLLLGTGSRLRSDDAAGSILAERFTSKIQTDDNRKRWVAVDAGLMPENYTSVVKREAPEILFIVDACDLGEEPGAVMRIEGSAISGEGGFNTHSTPLALFMKYLESLVDEIIFIGIQPKNIAVGESLSAEVEEAIDRLLCILIDEKFRDIPLAGSGG